MSKVLGIDLGTTNSCVALIEGASKPRIMPNQTGSHTTPSVVAFTKDGERLVGHPAKRQAVTNPENTVFAVKRLIGHKFDSAEVTVAREHHLPYQVVAADNGDAHISIRDHVYSPQEISAILLRHLKEQVEEALQEEVSDAIITVPAYFDDAQRQATRDAGRIAGLEVRRIINEPTAAALAYCLDRDDSPKHIAVYDLGGGTFDVSIMELSEEIFEVRATNGDADLGGEDFDRRIMDWLIDEFKEESGIDLGRDRMALQRLKEAAERAKAELSSTDEASISLPFVAIAEEGPLHFARSLSRDHLERLVADLVERTEAPCRDALEQAGLGPEDIDEVLLVGGQTRSPCVVEAVERIFAQKPKSDLNPDEVVAIGAAIQGGILEGTVQDVLLLDVAPLSLGIETRGGFFTKLIDRNSTIPTQASQIFTTVVDNQDSVEIHILQGEREIAEQNRSLGKIELVGIAPAPRGVPQIEVTFAIDSDSIHTVSAKDLASGESQTLRVDPASGLSEEEIERLVEEADAHAKSDRGRLEARQLRNRLEGLLQSTEKVFAQFSRYLPEEAQERMRESFRKALEAQISERREDMKAALVELHTISDDLSDLMLRTTRS